MRGNEENDFNSVCELCVNTIKGIVEPSEEISFLDKVEFVKNFVIWGTG